MRAVAALAVTAFLAAASVLAVRSVGESRRQPIFEGATSGGATSSVPQPSPGPATEAGPAPTTGPAVFSALQDQVAQVRGLAWLAPLDIEVVPKERLAQELRRAIERDSDPAELAVEESLMKLLDLLPADLDYSRLMGDLLAEQVRGFYDGQTKKLLVGGSGGPDLDPATKFVVVHEMVHALTDQHFDFSGRSDRLDPQRDTEQMVALAALIEGDATLAQYRWAREHLSQADALAAVAGASSGPSEVLSRTPAYLQAALAFPYGAGAEFVRSLYEAGGNPAVDNAYREPPTSTEHILHPQTYRAGESAAPPAVPDVATRAGCTPLRRGTMGEFDTRQVLDLHLGTRDAVPASAGWAGDAYVFVRCGPAIGLVDRWRGDTPGDARELAQAVSTWARRWSGGGGAPTSDGRFSGPAGSGRVLLQGDTVEMVLARDAATVDRLVQALG